MPIINLTAEDLEQRANQLLAWNRQLCDAGNRVKCTITQMDGWRDPQYQMFLSSVTMTHGQLIQYAASMEKLARSLKIYAQQQQEMVSSFGSNMNSIR